jgi:hypothetical protein
MVSPLYDREGDLLALPEPLQSIIGAAAKAAIK